MWHFLEIGKPALHFRNTLVGMPLAAKAGAGVMGDTRLKQAVLITRFLQSKFQLVLKRPATVVQRMLVHGVAVGSVRIGSDRGPGFDQPGRWRCWAVRGRSRCAWRHDWSGR